MTYYAYLHARPNTEDASGIFYVGKGNDKRIKKVYRKGNLHHTRIVNKYGEDSILVGKLPCSSESISFDLEFGLIKCLKRMGVKLTNKTDGGEGVSGFKFTPEQNLANSLRLTGKKASDKTRLKMSLSRMGNKYSLGKTLSDEHKEKLRKSSTGRRHTDIARKKMSTAALGNQRALGIIRSSETRTKMSQSSMGNKKFLGRKWIHLENTNKAVLSEQLQEYLLQGWALGMARKAKKRG